MPVRSMTAFAHQRREFSWGAAAWELRSVNQRYLELGFKLPEIWRPLEPSLRESLRKALSRGKVEVLLRFEPRRQHAAGLQVDDKLVEQLVAAAEKVHSKLRHSANIDPLAIMQWPGVVGEVAQDTGEIQTDLNDLFQAALTELQSGREREGGKLKGLIVDRLDQIADITSQLREQMPRIVTAQREKLQQRLEAMKAQLDEERLEGEIALLAQKIDVAEELDRLDTHLQEVRRVLAQGEACGRKLDFLMQELNREANTLSSKAVVAESTRSAVELKVLIEQMREQIQNIE